MKQWLFKGVIVVTGMALLWMFRVAIIEQFGQRMMNNVQQLQTQNLERIAAHQTAEQAQRDAEQQRILQRKAAARAKAERQAKLERAFEQQYTAPGGCHNWQSDRHMVECVNHRMRARRAFYETQDKRLPPTQRDGASVRSAG